MTRHPQRCVAAVAGWCAPAIAALPTVGAPAAAAPTSSGLWQASFGMLVVLAAIFGLAWLARRLGVRRLAGAGVLKVVSTTAVGARERVVVVEIAGTWLVLGVTGTQVNTLHTLPAKALPPGGAAVSEPAAGSVLGLFASKLRDASARKAAP